MVAIAAVVGIVDFVVVVERVARKRSVAKTTSIARSNRLEGCFSLPPGMIRTRVENDRRMRFQKQIRPYLSPPRTATGNASSSMFTVLVVVRKAQTIEQFHFSQNVMSRISVVGSGVVLMVENTHV